MTIYLVTEEYGDGVETFSSVIGAFTTEEAADAYIQQQQDNFSTYTVTETQLI